jgi:uncharacterized protein YbbK (DUF523 family)
MIAPKSGADHTEAITAWAQRRVEELAVMNLCGFIFKKDSPRPLVRFHLSGENSSS